MYLLTRRIKVLDKRLSSNIVEKFIFSYLNDLGNFLLEYSGCYFPSDQSFFSIPSPERVFSGDIEYFEYEESDVISCALNLGFRVYKVRSVQKRSSSELDCILGHDCFLVYDSSYYLDPEGNLFEKKLDSRRLICVKFDELKV